MATNITTHFKAASGIVVNVTAGVVNRVVAIHAATSAAGTFDLHDSTGKSKIKFHVSGSTTSDIYIGDQGIRFSGNVSVSLPSDGSSCTLLVG